jgi:uncharacterized protein
MSLRVPSNTQVSIETHNLVRRAGEMAEVHRLIDAPAELGNELIGVPTGSEMSLDLKLESVVEGILVSGEIKAHLVGECSRCLKPIESDEIFEVQELFFYAGKEADEDAFFVDNETIDLEPVIRDSVVLELPLIPVCSPDCLGLCLVCGFNLNDDPEHSHEAPVDPRWEALLGLETVEDAAELGEKA